MADLWKLSRIEAQAPTPKAWSEGKKLADGGAFSNVAPHPTVARGWQAATRGSSGTYDTLVIEHPHALAFGCTCPSHQHPCKHALGFAYLLATRPELRPEAAPPAAVAPELDALVRACFANPKQNLPRLVLADYLEERGETDRATILRLQCQTAPPKKKSEKPALPRGAAKPLAEAIKRLKPRLEFLTEAGIPCEFSRGFLTIRTMTWYLTQRVGVLTKILELSRTGWIETFDLWTMYPGLPTELVPLLSQAGTLDFSGSALDAGSLANLAAELRPGLPGSRVQTLLVHHSNRAALAKLLGTKSRKEAVVQPRQHYQTLTPASAKLLADAGTLDGVEELTLGGDPGEVGLRALAESTAMRQVSTLHLSSIDVPAEVWRPLWAVRNRRLSLLRLGDCPLGDAGVRDLCSGTFLPKTHLSLNQVGLSAAGVRTLAGCGRLSGLRHLDLSDNAVGDEWMGAALSSATFQSLAALSLQRTGVTPTAMIAAVFAAPHRPELALISDNLHVSLSRPSGRAAEFRLSRTDYGRTAQKCPLAGVCPEPLSAFEMDGLSSSRVGLRQVRDWLAGQTLKSLSLLRCDLRNDEVPALLELVAEVKPPVLDLFANEIGVKGCQALAASPALACVRTLTVTGNPIRLSGALALAASPHRANLKYVHMIGHDFSAAERKRIAAAFKGVKVNF